MSTAEETVVPVISNRDIKHFFDKQLLTDVTIVFKDKNGKSSSVTAHKLILAKFNFFEKLFTTEPHKNIHEVIMPNAHVAYDIILRLYGQDFDMTKKSARWLVDAIRCYDFLGTEMNITVVRRLALESTKQLFIDLDYSEIDVESFMEVTSILNYHNDTIEIIGKYFSQEHHLRSYSREMLQILIKHNQTYWLGYLNNGVPVIMGYNTNYREISFIKHAKFMQFSPNGHFCTFVTPDTLHVIKLVTIKTIELIWTRNVDTSNIKYLQFNPDSRGFICVNVNVISNTINTVQYDLYSDIVVHSDSTIINFEYDDSTINLDKDNVFIDMTSDARKLIVTYKFTEHGFESLYKSVMFSLDGGKIIDRSHVFHGMGGFCSDGIVVCHLGSLVLWDFQMCKYKIIAYHFTVSKFVSSGNYILYAHQSRSYVLYDISRDKQIIFSDKDYHYWGMYVDQDKVIMISDNKYIQNYIIYSTEGELLDYYSASPGFAKQCSNLVATTWGDNFLAHHVRLILSEMPDDE